MAFRTEIIFRGEAPANEYERAKIIAHPQVEAAIEGLRAALKDAGWAHDVGVHTIRTQEGRIRKPKMIPLAAE